MAVTVHLFLNILKILHCSNLLSIWIEKYFNISIIVLYFIFKILYIYIPYISENFSILISQKRNN